MGGLLQLGVRFLGPSVGRFTQVDPVMHGIDPYEYANGIPLRYIDMNGLRPSDYIAGIIEDFTDWWWIDWFSWYFFGSGNPIDLSVTGLLDDFMESPSVRSAIGAFEKRLDKVASSVARHSCKHMDGVMIVHFGDSDQKMYVNSIWYIKNRYH